MAEHVLWLLFYIMLKGTTEDFISKANKVHGNKYNYSLVIYSGCDNKVKIICPEHGIFEQSPYYHLKGQGCPICRYIKAAKNNPNLSNTEEFIEKANKRHNNFYDYSKVKYVNAKTKVCVICCKHGEFYVTPNNHLKGKGCPECGKIKKKEASKYTKEEWIELANKKHNWKYDYSKVLYNGSKEKVEIICPEHGEFWQNPVNHLSGDGCLKCGKVYRPSGAEWIKRANEIHCEKYDYAKTEYVNNHTKVCIICHEKDKNGKEHGEFWQIPANHLNGQGCPFCNESHGENLVRNILLDEEIEFIREKTFPWLKNEKTNRNLFYDFFLPGFNTAIEYQGEQHFMPTKHFGGNEEFKKRIENDKIKKTLSRNNNICILYVDYTEKPENIKSKIEALKNGKNIGNGG